jgi:phage tail-like protein
VKGSITMLDRAGDPVARYTFVEAWPRKYTGPTLDADGNQVVIESLEIVHEGLQITRPGDTR